MRQIKTRQPIINLLRPFLMGGGIAVGYGEAWRWGTTGGGAVIVGANNCLPQLRQKLSPGAAGAPQCGQTVAFRVGSLIRKSRMLAITEVNSRRCFYR